MNYYNIQYLRIKQKQKKNLLINKNAAWYEQMKSKRIKKMSFEIFSNFKFNKHKYKIKEKKLIK